MIKVTGTFSCSIVEEVALIQALLPEHIRLSRAEPGCLTFNVDPTADPLVWRLDESFADKAAFEAHQTRTRASAWFKATAQMRRDFQVTEV
jgi:quinol monooxygenase YgiN